MTPSRLRGAPIAASMLVVALVAGCSSHTSASSTTTSGATSTSVARVVPDDLRSTIFDGLPATYVEAPVGVDGDGPLGLAATAEAVDDNDPSQQKAILKQYGFRGAYQRSWVVKGTQEILIIRVQLMGSPARALGYYDLLTFAARTEGQLTAIPTPGLADASGFTRPFTTSAGPQVALDVSLARGALFYHLILTGPRGSVVPAEIVSIARSQATEAAALTGPS